MNTGRLARCQAVPELASDWIRGLERDPDTAIVEVSHTGISALANVLLERGYRT